MIWLLYGAALLSAVYFVGFCYRGPSAAKSLTKTGAVALLALLAWLGGGPLWLCVALSLSALGDYLLARGQESAFLAGVGAFAAAHLAYVVAFLAHPLADLSLAFAGGRLVLMLALIALGIVMAVLLFRRAGEMRYAVVAYVPVILSMSVAALSLPFDGPLSLILPGALLFLTSDLILAIEEFLLPEDHRVRRVTPFLVWPSYWGAQLLFVMGLFWLA